MTATQSTDKKFETGYAIFWEPGYLYSTTVWEDRVSAQAVMEEAEREGEDSFRGEQEVLCIRYFVEDGKIAEIQADDGSWADSVEELFIGNKS
tara:strand:+ start:627 stop:905 length:279 start_codon:yes stop_codon:yes gene_type:complete